MPNRLVAYIKYAVNIEYCFIYYNIKITVAVTGESKEHCYGVGTPQIVSSTLEVWRKIPLKWKSLGYLRGTLTSAVMQTVDVRLPIILLENAAGLSSTFSPDNTVLENTAGITTVYITTATD